MTYPYNKDDVLRMAKFLGDARYVVNYPSTIGLMEEAAAMLRAYAEVAEGWRPIETVPKDGSHVLVTWAGGAGFGVVAGKSQDFTAVAHWFNDGLYNSTSHCDHMMKPWEPTHWQPLTAALSGDKT